MEFAVVFKEGVAVGWWLALVMEGKMKCLEVEEGVEE